MEAGTLTAPAGATCEMEVQYVWFPTHGRMRRRIEKRGRLGLAFRGQLISINGLRIGLVYERVG